MECGAWAGKSIVSHFDKRGLETLTGDNSSLCSATLDLAYTAMGAFDIWWEGGCWEW